MYVRWEDMKNEWKYSGYVFQLQMGYIQKCVSALNMFRLWKQFYTRNGRFGRLRDIILTVFENFSLKYILLKIKEKEEKLKCDVIISNFHKTLTINLLNHWIILEIKLHVLF